MGLFKDQVLDTSKCKFLRQAAQRMLREEPKIQEACLKYFKPSQLDNISGQNNSVKLSLLIFIFTGELIQRAELSSSGHSSFEDAVCTLYLGRLSLALQIAESKPTSFIGQITWGEYESINSQEKPRVLSPMEADEIDEMQDPLGFSHFSKPEKNIVLPEDYRVWGRSDRIVWKYAANSVLANSEIHLCESNRMNSNEFAKLEDAKLNKIEMALRRLFKKWNLESFE